MTLPAGLSEERLLWDQTDEVARGILREAHMMPFSAIGLSAVGWLYGSLEMGLAWGAAMLVSTSVLLLTCIRYRRRGFQPGATNGALWQVYFASLFQSAVTGGHMVMFWRTGAVEANLVLLLIFMASAMFAVTLTSTSRALLITNSVFHLVLCVAVLALEGGKTFNVLAMLAPLYFGALASSGARTYLRGREVLILAHEREAMITSLKSANEAKTIFLANMSHELRTPLNAIIGFSELMKNETFGAHKSAKYREYSHDIHSSGSHLLDLINDLLDGARVDSGNYVPNDESFALAGLLDECVRLVAGRAGEKKLTLQSPSDSGIALTADRRGMKQVIINLLANAVKFTPAGGLIQLGVLREPDGSLLISVTDNGPGIEEAELTRIFQSFGQGRHDIAERDRGVGLGLAIVKGILSAHDGSIEAQSAPGKGTSMRVHLPASRVVQNEKARAA